MLSRLRFTELTSARAIGTILERLGNVVSSDSLTEATLTLWDLETEQILNNRDSQDVLGTTSPPTENGVTLYPSLQTDPDGTTYNVEWLLDPADNAIVTERRQVERHRAMFVFKWPDGEMRMEFEIDVDNLRKAP